MPDLRAACTGDVLANALWRLHDSDKPMDSSRKALKSALRKSAALYGLILMFWQGGENEFGNSWQKQRSRPKAASCSSLKGPTELERARRFELSASTLARLGSTPELRPHCVSVRPDVSSCGDGRFENAA